MESKAKLFGHPIHPMLIVFPLGLLGMALIFDIIYLVTGNISFALAAGVMIPAGLITGLLAAIFGVIDWMAIPADTRAKRVGFLHGVGNVVVVVLFFLSWSLRDRGLPAPLSMVLALLGGGLSVVTGWLGGELVDRLGVGVDRGAHLNSPNSLSGRPASENTTSTVRTR